MYTKVYLIIERKNRMRINFSHYRDKSTTGGCIDYAVFEARSQTGSESDNDTLLLSLTIKARNLGYKIDKSALAYLENGELIFFGDSDLVNYLKMNALPNSNNHLDLYEHI